MNLLKRRVAACFHQTIPSRLEAVEELCAKIRHFLEESGLAEFRFAVELLSRECLNNAVIHARGSDADKTVDLALSITRDWVRLQVQDKGPGFAWRKACRKRPDSIECSGRGLQICAFYAERIRFNRSGNRIELWIRRCGEMKRVSGHGHIHSETRR